MENKKLMTETEKHKQVMNQLNSEWDTNTSLHTHQRKHLVGIRSSQISALVMFLIRKGIL